MITKVITKSNWEIAKIIGEINEDSLIEEGFIHCSLVDQALKAEVKYELASNGQEYPHVYGVINVEAIVEVVPLHKENGEFIPH
ncbi:DUF952 domain-containing protein [Bacillus cereus]|uniref:DUF952 domain-containing protein n=1 Tax=Bacillus cereus TaxID=1396 RepID=UPI003D65BED1